MLNYKLDNGIRLIGENLPHLHTLSMGIWVGVGSQNELDSENGLSHFIEHMVFKGTATRTARDIAEEMDSIGAGMNAFTSKNCTCFYVRSLDRDMYKGLEMLCDLVYRPRFDEIELEKERQVVLEEIAMSLDTPEDLISDIAASSVHEGSLSKTILGPESLIKSYSRKDLCSYWQKHYTPSNIVISVVGNYNEQELIKITEELFSSSPNKTTRIEKSKNTLKLGSSYLNKDIEQDHILLTYPAYELNSNMEYAMSVVNNILGGGMSSRIFQKVREELGLAYSVYSYTNKYAQLGTLCIYAGTNSQSAVAVIKALTDEIEKLKHSYITQKEFNIGKAQIMSSLEFSMESSAARMSRIGRSLLLCGTVPSQDQIIKDIDSITMDNINEVINHCFMCKPAISILGPNAEEVFEKIDNLKF